ncbi:peptidoglycan-binding protein [Amylibacter sp. SFDW26]|uniref:holin-associated N-acetylmuramidase n=1 Tax=Amylibacter sp. SFDW26 TaxID=2652722 RepID=UPI0012622BDA|nr:holin-associated N-acetylmuramidase [Amylibacter sp. SFDW26]KAB7616380.1 peptidoglycan-binding protein [Amylibacter sp. SFDW26]
MDSVDTIAAEIVHREGGFVNDPDDPGGATKYGVTIHTMRRLGLDLTGDGQIDVNDVRRLSVAQAVDIFKKHYFYKPKIDQLPNALQVSVFDMQVNAGGTAIKLLQKLLNAFGEDVVADGALGPQSIEAAGRVFMKAPDHLVDAYGIERRNYYYRLADKRPKSRKYARRRNGGKGGWIIRAEEFIAERFHLTQAEHIERTAQWV